MNEHNELNELKCRLLGEHDSIELSKFIPKIETFLVPKNLVWLNWIHYKHCLRCHIDIMGREGTRIMFNPINGVLLPVLD